MPQVKGYTTCCHMCRTSLNQHKREYLPCTTCNWILCKNCFGTKIPHINWYESVLRKESWRCPGCEGTCPCPRCVKLGPRIMKRPPNKPPMMDSLPESQESLQQQSNGEEEFSDQDEKPLNLSKQAPKRSHPIVKRRKLEDSPKASESESEGEEDRLDDLMDQISNETSIVDSSTSPSFNGKRSFAAMKGSRASPVEDENPKTKIAYNHLEELTNRENRCDQTIREMERMLQLMKREKQEIAFERQKIAFYIEQSKQEWLQQQQQQKKELQDQLSNPQTNQDANDNLQQQQLLPAIPVALSQDQPQQETAS